MCRWDPLLRHCLIWWAIHEPTYVCRSSHYSFSKLLQTRRFTSSVREQLDQVYDQRMRKRLLWGSKFAEGGVESIYMVNEIILFRYAYHHSLKLVSRVFLQAKSSHLRKWNSNICQALNLSCSMMRQPFRWRYCCPIYPPCPILSPSSPQYLALPAPLASSPTRTLYPVTSSSSSTTCLFSLSSQSVAFSSSTSSPPPSSASQPLDFLSRFLVYPSFKLLKAADALLHPWFVEDLDEGASVAGGLSGVAVKGGLLARRISGQLCRERCATTWSQVLVWVEREVSRGVLFRRLRVREGGGEADGAANSWGGLVFVFVFSRTWMPEYNHL